MELFNDNERIVRIYTIRRVPQSGGARFSRNRHHFLIPDATYIQAASGCFEGLGLAERHAMMPSALLFSQIAVMLPKMNEPLENLQAVASFYQGYGGRKLYGSETLVPYPVVMMMRKYCAYGRTSKLFYEGMLCDADLVYEGNGRVHLRGDYDWTALVSNYVNFYMDACPFPYIVTHTPKGAEYPAGYRTVQRFGGFTAERLTSVPDAQHRKTHRALPYQEYSRTALEPMQAAGDFVYGLCHVGYPTYDAAARETIFSLVGNFQGALMQIAPYYGEGQEPDYADCWRPTAGLNPYSMLAQEILQKVADAVSAFGQAVADVPEDEEHRFAVSDLENALPLWYRACGLYMLFLDAERFTGTPKYIPRQLSQCRGA